MIPINEYLIAHHWSVGGDPDDQVITYGLKNSSIELNPEATLSGVAQSFDECYFGQATSFRNGWIYKGFVATKQTDTGLITYDRTVSRPSTQTNFNGVPTNCALLISKVTGAGGRRNRGRMFLPAAYLPEDIVDQNGYISNVSMDALQDGAQDWMNKLSTHDLNMTIHHVLAPHNSTEVTSLRVNNQIATQRRRMRS